MSTQEPDESQKIFLDFYEGKRPNLNGVLFETILSYSDVELEVHHSFIQWLFPMRKPSQMTTEPIALNEQIIKAFHEDSNLQKRQLCALDLMLSHYGLQREGDIISLARDFNRKKQFLSGHNLARIDRILNSLIELGNQKWAQALFNCLSKLSLGADFVNSLENYWKRTVDA